MDLGVALANLIGLSVYFDQYFIKQVYDPTYEVPGYIQRFCKTQAFFAAFCTYSSILWTIALAGFLYFLIVHHKTRIAIYFYWSSHIVCYVLPLMVSLWLMFTHKLGYSPVNSSGWCTLINRDIVSENPDYYITVFGNDLWVYLTIVTIPFLYMSIKCYLANQVSSER
jgi:G protein-coupled receptor 157